MDTSLGPWKKIDDGSPVRVNAMPDLRLSTRGLQVVLPPLSVGGYRVNWSCARALSLISRDAVLSAMLARLTTRWLTFRDIFVCTPMSLLDEVMPLAA